LTIAFFTAFLGVGFFLTVFFAGGFAAAFLATRLAAGLDFEPDADFFFDATAFLAAFFALATAQFLPAPSPVRWRLTFVTHNYTKTQDITKLAL
jgi:hypothetical protein